MRCVRTARRGMTLIELLIGMVVTGLALAAGYAAFSFVIDHRGQTQATVDPVVRAATMRRTLLGWMTYAVIQRPTKAVPTDGLQLGMDNSHDVLRVVTTASTPLGTDSTTVLLTVNTADTIKQHGLVALMTPTVGADSLRIQLDSTVTGMRVEYLVEQNSQLRWISTAELSATPKLSPFAMRLTLLSDRPQAISPLLSMPIVVPTRSRS